MIELASWRAGGWRAGGLAGWRQVAMRGSHRQFKQASMPGRVTIAGKPSDDLAPGTLDSIRKQAGLKEGR